MRPATRSTSASSTVTLTVAGSDVVVRTGDPTVTVGEVAAAVTGHEPASLAVDGRELPTSTPLGAAALRPGDVLATTTRHDVAPPAGELAVHVVAGVDAGRVVGVEPGQEVRVGRASGATVRLAANGVSGHHCTLRVEGSVVLVADAGSRNGTVVAGHRIPEGWTEVPVGDPIRCGPAVLVVRAVAVPDPPAAVAGALATAPTGPVPFYRSPVDLPPGPPGEVVAPEPPRRPRTGRPGLLALLLPLVFAAVMVRLTGQILFALFALMGPVLLLVSLADRAARNRRTRKRSGKRFREELVDFAAELGAARDHELRRRRDALPDPTEVLRRAATPSAALWDRRRDHPRFLATALGVADLTWVPPVAGAVEDEPDLEAAVRAASSLPTAPVELDVEGSRVVGLAGERAVVLATARSLVLQTAVAQGPAEVAVLLVCSQAAAAGWEWVKWLPHLRAGYAGGPLLAVTGDAAGWVDVGVIDDVLADTAPGTALHVVVDGHGLSDGGDAAVRRLLRREGVAASGLVVAGTADALPDVCDAVVEHGEAAGEAVVRWPRRPERTTALVVAGVAPAAAERAARRLARLHDPDVGGGSAALPAAVPLSEVLELTDATVDDVRARWSVPRSLVATVGAAIGGPAEVDLAAEGPHLLVAGGRGSGKTEALAGIVVALAATHPPERMRLLLWGEALGHLAGLPHVTGVATRVDEDTAGRITDAVEAELARRERRRTSGAVGGAGTGPGGGADPALVVVVDDVDTLLRLVPAAGEDLVRVLRRARGLGVHVLWASGRSVGGVMGDLVDLSPARLVLRVGSPNESTDLLGTAAAARLARALPGRGFLATGRGEPREVQAGALSTGVARSTARVEVAPFSIADGRRGRVAAVPAPPDERTVVPLLVRAGAGRPRPPDLLSPAAAAAAALESPGLLDLLGISALDGPDGLDPAARWRTVDDDGLLRVPIGVGPDMAPVELDLKESALGGMGPHGLLVGATGSGKSELLRTLVTGLAVTHHPELLSFVLVDFKGGASFAGLSPLPHVAGLVTNLADDLALVDRILAALDGEARRRQELLAAAGNLASAREYRARRAAGTLPDAVGDQPFPELVIVVDEFAELLDTEPEFIAFFLTIGRVGRSLGIHLLLASQRLEEGKLRGLDTYLSYRLGLRTFSAAESRIVLGVPDAYTLPPAPGGGYLKVGTTSFDRFQASYVSGPAPVAADAEGDADPAAEPVTVLDAVVERLAGAAAPVHQVWLPPLPPSVALDPLFGPEGFVHSPERGFAAAAWPGTGRLAVPVGILDQPELQRQVALVLDLAGAQGHLAVAGAPQSGKSLLLRSLVLSLAVTHTPEEVQVYAVDLGGGGLATLDALPHVGAVAGRAEPERVHRLLHHVESVLARREAHFRDADVDSVATFRARRAAGEVPSGEGADVFLVVDGWATFRERFESLEPVVVDLAARGLGFGVHVVLSANRWLEVRANVIDSIGGRLELRLNNPSDSAVDRKRAATLRAELPGRGLYPSRHVVHVALPRLDGGDDPSTSAAATRAAAQHVAARWSGAPAPPVRLLPTRVHVSELPAPDPARTPAPVGVPVGLAEDDLDTWWFDLTTGDPHFTVFGDGESGKTTFLRTWLSGLVQRTEEGRARVLLVDYRRTLLEVVPDSHLLGYAASEPAAAELVAATAATITKRLPGAEVTPAQLRDRSWWTGPELYVVVDDHDLVLTPSGSPLAPLLPLVAQGRDVGLHLVLARRVSGATKVMFEPVTARARDVSPAGLVLAGDRAEGPVLGPVRAGDQPPGRGLLVSRRHAPRLVQVALSDTG